MTDEERWWREPGDWEDDLGILHDSVTGRVKETAYEAADGTVVRFPVLSRDQARRMRGASRDDGSERRRSACFRGEFAQLASWGFDALEGYDGRVLETCRLWARGSADGEAQQRSVVLFGAPGTGKTCLAAAMANLMIERGMRGTFTSIRAVSAMASERFGQVGSILARMCSRDFVVLDDLFSERGSSWSLDQVFTVVDYVSKSRARLVVTTNLSENQIRRPNERAARIVGRVREGAVLLEVGGPDRRQPALGGGAL